MESQVEEKKRIRIGFDMIDSGGGYELLLDTITGFLVGHFGATVIWRDMEGAVVETTPEAIKALKEYLKWLKSNVRVRREDAWGRLPVDELIISVEEDGQ